MEHHAGKGVRDIKDDVLYQRKAEKISQDSASEFYPHVKLILQAGSRTDDNYKYRSYWGTLVFGVWKQKP